MEGSDLGQSTFNALQNISSKSNNWTTPQDLNKVLGLDDVETLLYGLLSLTVPVVDPYALQLHKNPVLQCIESILPSYSPTAWGNPPPVLSSQGSSSSVASPGGMSVPRTKRSSRGRNRRIQPSVRGLISEKERPICFDYAQGRCTRKNCQYQHDVGAIVRHNSREKRICFDYLRGECKRGNTCRFSHNIQPLVSQWLGETPDDSLQRKSSLEPRKKRGVCYDFVRDRCNRGRRCPWTHNLFEIACATTKNNGKLSPEENCKISLATLKVLSGNCDLLPQKLARQNLLKQVENLRLSQGMPLKTGHQVDFQLGSLERDLSALKLVDTPEK